jgi:hypothetical protein
VVASFGIWQSLNNADDDDRKINQSFFQYLRCHDKPIKIQKSSLGNRQSKGRRNLFSVWDFLKLALPDYRPGNAQSHAACRRSCRQPGGVHDGRHERLELHSGDDFGGDFLALETGIRRDIAQYQGFPDGGAEGAGGSDGCRKTRQGA